MTTTPSGMDFEALTRQYWSAWGDMLRNGGAKPDAMHAGTHAWHQGIDWWTQQVHGNRSDVNTVVERFNSQARNWYGQMQQVAAQFAGHDASAGEVARAWKQAMGAVGENPFPEMFRAMRGQGQQGLDQWIEDASPYLDAWKGEGKSWLGMPAFGFAREGQERKQALTQALLDYQDRTSAYNALMMKSAQRAHEVFEDKLAERSEPGRQLQSARAMFDLWIDSAEEAYAEIALSPEFSKVYGALVDAQMRVRGGMQKEVEQMSEKLGMPTRTEVDGAHRKIAELERQLRRLRDAAAAPTPTPTSKQVSRVAEGSLKVAGDPLTGPRTATAKPTRTAAKAASTKAMPKKPTKPGPKKPTKPTKGKR